MLINYYFNKLSKAPAQLSVLHICGENGEEKKPKKKQSTVKRTCLHVFINSHMALFFQQILFT